LNCAGPVKPEMPEVVVAMIQLPLTLGLKLTAFPGTSPAVREVMLMLNGLPELELICNPPVMFNRLQPGSAPAAPVALLTSQIYVPPPLRFILPVLVRVPIASKDITVPLMVVPPTTVPTQWRVCAAPTVNPL